MFPSQQRSLSSSVPGRRLRGLGGSVVAIFLATTLAFAQGGGGAGGGGAGGGPGGAGAGGGAIAGGINAGNIANIINGITGGNVNAGNIANIIGNLPAGTNLGNLANLINGNGQVSTTPTIITASGLLVGDSGTANVIVPTQAANAIAGGATDPNAIVGTNTNTYLWTITGGTITSDATRPTVTFTADKAGTITLSVDVTVVGSSPVNATATVTVISPDDAGTITAPATVSTGAASATASVPAAQNNDRTFRWTVTGDASIVSGATTNTLTFKPGTPGVKTLNCAVVLQRLVTVNLKAFVVVTGSGPSVTITITNGSGGGTYAGGSRVDIFANPPPAGQVFDRWTGDTSVLGTGALAPFLPHVLITVPSTPVALTATYKAAQTWTTTTVTGFNPQTSTNASGQTVTQATTLVFYIPTGATGIVFLLHDTAGTAGAWFTTPERALLARDLVAAGYGVVALNSVNRTAGTWNQQTTLANNFDAQNVAAALDKFSREGVTAAGRAVFLLGEAAGASAASSYADLLVAATPSRPIKGVVLYLAAGTETQAVTSTVPRLYALAANDENLGTAGNTTARTNSQLLAGRGIATGSSTSAVTPVYQNRFRSLAITVPSFSTSDASAVWTALKNANLLDANNYLKSLPTEPEVKAVMPAAYQSRAADVASALAVSNAASEFYSENDARVIAFLNARVAGTPAPAPGRMANLSTRTKLPAVGSSFTLGFNLAGSDKATLLIRGVGPKLGEYGVADALAAPRLEFYQGATLLVANEGWDKGGAAVRTAVANAAASVGAFALTDGSADAAVLLTNLSPGSYTVKILGVNGSVGDVLAEVYDVSKNNTRLTNLSTLATINDDGGVILPAIVIQGANPRTLLARAVGPGLEPYGVPLTSSLGDPRLTVLNGSNATVASNNNWSQGGATGQAAALTAAFPATGAFSLKTGTTDAALVAAFAAGSYTLQADAAPVPTAGNGQAAAAVAANQTGLVLVEVYEVP